MPKNNPSRWSQAVTEKSHALDLPQGIFTWQDPEIIAQALKASALNSQRRKGTPYQSAMSMLNFYINRAGKQLPSQQKEILMKAKEALKMLFKEEDE